MVMRSSAISSMRGLSVAVAFAKQSALGAVNVEEWCAPDRKLDVLAGTDFFLTELDLLRRLEKRPHATCRIFHTMGKTHVGECTQRRGVLALRDRDLAGPPFPWTPVPPRSCIRLEARTP